MSRFGMRGTPSLVLLDQAGQIVAHHLGQVSELQLGSEIGSLLTQEVVSTKGGTVTLSQSPDSSH
ncbi:TlpA family protein disulfide reductase [Ruegeria denitrificans]|uniref:TlpA family protein disulfide reductase n=1 Tax=Ruegeria denitrificans TaxID=1715692 RepID=UPI000A90A704|nr:hypothetical protein [Ruegeria denitrificans]